MQYLEDYEKKYGVNLFGESVPVDRFKPLQEDADYPVWRRLKNKRNISGIVMLLGTFLRFGPF
jgi:hypothetical protein